VIQKCTRDCIKYLFVPSFVALVSNSGIQNHRFPHIFEIFESTVYESPFVCARTVNSYLFVYAQIKSV